MFGKDVGIDSKPEHLSVPIEHTKILNASGLESDVFPSHGPSVHPWAWLWPSVKWQRWLLKFMWLFGNLFFNS